MQINSGILKLSSKERNALRVIRSHTITDFNYGGQGTYNKIKGGDYDFDVKEAEKGKLGLDIIDFILSITE